MITVTFLIQNYDTLDSMVSVTVPVQAVPRVGEVVWMSGEMKDEFIRQALRDDRTLDLYDGYVFGTGKDLHLSFDSCVYAVRVFHILADQSIRVILADDMNPELSTHPSDTALTEAERKNLRKNHSNLFQNEKSHA